MKFRIFISGGALLAFAAAAFAQTGVSGQPGISTALTTTPDASSSPVVAPPPPAPTPTSGTSSTAPPSPYLPARPARNAPPPPASPSAPAPPVQATPLKPLTPEATVPPPPPPPPPPAPAPETPPPAGKHGASFYERYLSNADEFDRAIFDLTARVQANPSDAGLRNDLGNLLARRGFAKEAADQYQKASKLDPAFYLADYNEGLLWEKEGKSSAAIKAYERSIKKKPGFPLSRFHLGFLLEKEGKNEAAIEEYAKALRIDPSLRWPARNPLVVQSRILYRASLVNYGRDLASTDVADEESFADRAVWERLHPERTVSTTDLESENTPEEGEPEPAVAGTGSPTTAPLIGGKAAPAKPADARRQQLIDQFRRNRAARPVPVHPQPTVAPVPPAEVPAPPENENAPNPAMQQEEPPPPSHS